jgi:hypothetical protein
MYVVLDGNYKYTDIYNTTEWNLSKYKMLLYLTPIKEKFHGIRVCTGHSEVTTKIFCDDQMG